MNTQERNKRDHYISVAISCVLNGGLILAMIHLITAGPQRDPDLNTTLILDPVEEQIIEEFEEEEIIREEVELEEIPDIDLNTDFDINVETDFTPDQEAFDAPQDTTNVNQLTELLSDIASPVVMAGIMPGRTQLARQAALNRYAGGMGGATEAAVQRALRWLASVQLDDGSWNAAGQRNNRGQNTGLTGLALLTFLSNGQTPSSAEYGSTVSRAIRYLVEIQQPDGMIWRQGHRHQTYAHAIATYALAEAYTMTNNILLREPLERAVQVMIRHQLADGGFAGPPAQGGGGYQYGGTGQSDNSVTAWNIQALKAAQIATMVHGFEIQGLERAIQRGMDAMLGISFMRNNELHFGYTPANSNRLNSVITEAAALCLMLTGRANTREARNVVGHIAQNIPTWGEAHKSSYGGAINMWYYAVQAIFHNDPDGADFRNYNRGMATALIQNQHPDGYWVDFQSDRHGPVFDTTLAALGLMVYYRYLPTTQADRIQQQPAPTGPAGGAADDDIIRITL